MRHSVALFPHLPQKEYLMRSSLQRIAALMLLSPMLLLNASCESVMQHKETVIGGVIGGGGGAIIGKALGDEKGAVIGGLSGVVIGAAIGHYLAKQERTRTETTAAVGYRPEQGNVLTISDATAAPTFVQKGDRVKVSFKYTILRPDEEQAQVKETHEIRYNGTPVETLPSSHSLAQGEQRITWEYPVKSNAQAGTYQILTTAQVDEKQTASIVSFTVK